MPAQPDKRLLRKLKKAENGFEKMAVNFERWQQTTPNLGRELLDRALEQCEPKIRDMLKANYEQSGIGKKKAAEIKPWAYKSRGVLKGMISRADIRIPIHGKPRISIELPEGPDYEHTTKKGKTNITPFNRVAGALNYGAVIMRKTMRTLRNSAGGGLYREAMSDPVGPQAKRTLKKYALGKAVSQRALSAVERETRSRVAGGVIRAGFQVGEITNRNKKGTVKVAGGKSGGSAGGFTVIKPRECFTLTPAQRDAIGKDMSAIIGGWLRGNKRA